jgi:hypothetical protein
MLTSQCALSSCFTTFRWLLIAARCKAVLPCYKQNVEVRCINNSFSIKYNKSQKECNFCVTKMIIFYYSKLYVQITSLPQPNNQDA